AVCGAVRAAGVRHPQQPAGSGEDRSRPAVADVKRFAAIALLCAGCGSKGTPPRVPASEQSLPPDVEAISLLGKPLHAPELAPAEQKRREGELAKAQREYALNPDSADAAIAAGDRLADLGRYREAID